LKTFYLIPYPFYNWGEQTDLIRKRKILARPSENIKRKVIGFYTDEEGRKRPITERKKSLMPPILYKYYYNRLMFKEKSKVSQSEYTKNDWEKGISKAVGIEKAEEEMIYVINDDENRRVVVMPI
jgi:hypothetical protein